MELSILEIAQLTMGLEGPFYLRWLLGDIQTYDLAPADEQQALALATIGKLLELELMQAGDLADDGEFLPWNLAPEETVKKIERQWNALGRDPILYEIVWFKNTAEGDRIGASGQIAAGGPMLAEAMQLTPFEQQLVLECCEDRVGLERIVLVARDLRVASSNDDVRHAVIAALDRLMGARLIGAVWLTGYGRLTKMSASPHDITYLDSQWHHLGDVTNPGDLMWFGCLEDGEELARRWRRKGEEQL